MKKVNILWAVVPTILLIAMSLLSYGYYSRAHKYIGQQDKAITSYIGALDEANFNTTYNATYVLEQLKLVVGNDQSEQQLGFNNIINFKSKQAVTPPPVPNKINL